MMRWLNNKLKQEIRQVFEPRYKRNLSEKEVLELAKNLANLTEIFSKFKYRQNLDKLT